MKKMKETALAEFEGTEFEKDIDNHLSNGGWNDIVVISPDKEVIRIEENIIDLFYRQKADELDKWTKVVR
jgi:hypothetical protein